MWKNGFSPICAPHGLPHVIFSFFSDRMCWVECSFTYFMQEIMNFFIFYSIFFHYFCPFFRRNTFWPIYPHLMPPPPWTTPYQLWPSFVPPHSLSPANLSMTLWIKKIWIFEIFGKHFFLAIFGHFTPWRPPS